ncbi:MAG: hypothetical protein ACM3QZ_08835 [Solirubrobacterales bacterium]
MEHKKILWGAAAVLVLVFGIAGYLSADRQPVSAPADNRSHPILVSWWNETGMLLGASQNGAWRSIDPQALNHKQEGVLKGFPLVAGGERYKIYTRDRYLGVYTGGKAALRLAALPVVAIGLMPKLKPEQEYIAVAGDWNPRPRVPAKIQPDASIRQVLQNRLTYYGLPGAPLKIDQVWEIDLDHDGKVEQLVEATHLPDVMQASPDTYSMVFLMNGTRSPIMLRKDFRTKKVEKDGAPPLKFSVAAILDLNGDSQMEVVLRSSYYEGEWTEVYEIKGNQAELVLTEGNGL